jgi:hypothetical protein
MFANTLRRFEDKRTFAIFLRAEFGFRGVTIAIL